MQQFSTGVILPLGGHLAMSGDVFWLPQRHLGVESRDAAKHPSMHATATHNRVIQPQVSTERRHCIRKNCENKEKSAQFILLLQCLLLFTKHAFPLSATRWPPASRIHENSTRVAHCPENPLVKVLMSGFSRWEVNFQKSRPALNKILRIYLHKEDRL